MDSPLIIRSAEFIKSAVRPESYPSGHFPEVAFAGRSNVGKSSLINCLVQRKKLVRTSRTPGQTQLLNFFLINGTFHLVDLPGYGFARAPMKVRAQWGVMIETYLTRRQTLKGVVQILDARHPPTPDDLNVFQWLHDKRIPVIPVLTKADKLTKSQWNFHIKQVSLSLGIPAAEIILFSSATQQGRSELLQKLAGWVSLPEDPVTP
ncbi:ribosome biogenesis GTP-binding protein YihA/YsxC [Desulforhabdus sp. TSK]|uniref:ribosome biogenesis GTP-binding protein YihA/YsxC n=1 Tax=Desulforhabdus sp. TSK TaxID=2925014 RepID=UPI001FC849A7|nr:ribosome biogenesis GTP-binding protein YihA/YsxC [Desulforhabdus sp. TSK]GKT10054.1 putative GTP-binding protein EngB [Desulforhabdus sp. TSK]